MEQKPIIVKRIKKVVAGGHHGGSWKVAYADFVTAMMAFFLLMWLMGFTTEGQRAAIADFFQNPSAIQGTGGASTSPINMQGGMEAAKKPPEAPPKETPTRDTQEKSSREAPSEFAPTADNQKDVEKEKIAQEKDKERLEALSKELQQTIEASQALKPFKDQLFIDITAEGLRIQIVDKENRPMFDVGSSTLQSYTRVILREIGKMISTVPNRISIAGHTDGRAYADATGFTNWELSTERANATRREMVSSGMPDQKVARVVGLASTALFDKANPLSPVNRRISIVVLNRETEAQMQQKEAAEKTVTQVSEIKKDELPMEAPGAPKSEAPAPVIETPKAVKPVEPAKAEPAKAPPSPEPAKLAPAKKETPPVEAPKASVAPDTAKKSAPKSEPAKVETNPTEPAKTDASKKDKAAKPEKPGAAKTEKGTMKTDPNAPPERPATIQLPGLPIQVTPAPMTIQPITPADKTKLQ